MCFLVFEHQSTLHFSKIKEHINTEFSFCVEVFQLPASNGNLTGTEIIDDYVIQLCLSFVISGMEKEVSSKKC